MNRGNRHAAGTLRLTGTVENFFGPPHRQQHEIGFSFRMELPPELPDEPFPMLDNAEVLCGWVPVGETESRPVYPLIIRELLHGDDGTARHIVNRQ